MLFVYKGVKIVLTPFIEILIADMEKRGIGGEITNFGEAKACPIIPGLEILYFGKECPEQVEINHSELKDLPSTIVVQKRFNSDFCIIYRMGKHLPTAFIRYGCEILLLINAEQLCYDDLQAFPEAWEYLLELADTLQIDQQFCVVKSPQSIKGIFEELQQIPFPPTLFRFYMLLKSVELILLISTLKPSSTQLHFYPYKEIPQKEQ